MSAPPSFAFEKVTGARHLRAGKPCQDDVGATTAGSFVALAVADGHGTSVFAEVGAALAIRGVLPALIQFAAELGPRATDLASVQAWADHPLRVQLVRDWVDRVRTHADDPATDLSAFGSTLVFVLATPDFVLFGQLGDGDVLVVDPDGSVTSPLPADPAVFGDETTSLCQPEAWMALRVRVIPPPSPGTLVLIATDGYSKSYPNDEEFRRIGPDYAALLTDGGLPMLAPHLRDFLEEVTTRGSGDDIALGLLHWPRERQ